MSSSDGSRPGRPWWRPLVDGIDRRVTPPANAFVRTNLFADAVSVVTRLEVRLRRTAERQSSWWLHQWNLPSAGDIRSMRAQLAALEARIRDLSERIEDQQLDAERQRRPQRRSTARGKAGADS